MSKKSKASRRAQELERIAQKMQKQKLAQMSPMMQSAVVSQNTQDTETPNTEGITEAQYISRDLKINTLVLLGFAVLLGVLYYINLKTNLFPNLGDQLVKFLLKK